MTVLVPPNEMLWKLSQAHASGDLHGEDLEKILELHYLARDYTVQQLLDITRARPPLLPVLLAVQLSVLPVSPYTVVCSVLCLPPQFGNSPALLPVLTCIGRTRGPCTTELPRK